MIILYNPVEYAPDECRLFYATFNDDLPLRHSTRIPLEPIELEETDATQERLEDIEAHVSPATNITDIDWVQKYVYRPSTGKIAENIGWKRYDHLNGAEYE